MILKKKVYWNNEKYKYVHCTYQTIISNKQMLTAVSTVHQYIKKLSLYLPLIKKFKNKDDIQFSNEVLCLFWHKNNTFHFLVKSISIRILYLYLLQVKSLKNIKISKKYVFVNLK